MLGLSPDPIKDYETVSLREDTQSSGDTSFRKSKKKGGNLCSEGFFLLATTNGIIVQIATCQIATN